MATGAINRGELTPEQARFADEHDAIPLSWSHTDPRDVLMYRENRVHTVRWLVGADGQAKRMWILHY